MAIMRTDLLVIDNNLFRNEMFFQNTLTPWFMDGNGLLIPDAHFAEIWKSDQWRYISTLSHNLLKNHIDKLYIATQPGELIRKETSSGVPTTNDGIVDLALTTRFRMHLSNAYSDPNLDSAADSARPFILDQHYQHACNQQDLAKLISTLKDLLKPALTDIRKMGNNDLAALVRDIFLHIGEHCLLSYDNNQLVAKSLASSMSIAAIDLVVRFSHAVYWVSKDGFDSRKLDQASNDLIDFDYIIFGICTSSFHSKDSKTDDLYQIAKIASGLLWQSQIDK